ncbi:hypothetical protein [Streptacidiphilus monticola]|uniref:Uncharacterized protein n=1 Tax=Streptacidiphilus monticola TaxID=2161674 RepID=A0ABW1G5N5_9ACTN
MALFAEETDARILSASLDVHLPRHDLLYDQEIASGARCRTSMRGRIAATPSRSLNPVCSGRTSPERGRANRSRRPGAGTSSAGWSPWPAGRPVPCPGRSTGCGVRWWGHPRPKAGGVPCRAPQHDGPSRATALAEPEAAK